MILACRYSYMTPAFLSPPIVSATPALMIPRAKNRGVSPKIVLAAPVTLPDCPALTVSATVPIRFTPTMITINPPSKFPSILISLPIFFLELDIYKPLVIDSNQNFINNYIKDIIGAEHDKR